MEATLVYETGILKMNTAPADLNAGEVRVVGNRIGVVYDPDGVDTGDPYTLIAAGIFTMAAKSADSWSDGDLLYWDDTNNELTTTAGSNTPAGLAVWDKAASATTARCDINASVASRTV